MSVYVNNRGTRKQTNKVYSNVSASLKQKRFMYANNNSSLKLLLNDPSAISLSGWTNRQRTWVSSKGVKYVYKIFWTEDNDGKSVTYTGFQNDPWCNSHLYSRPISLTAGQKITISDTATGFNGGSGNINTVPLIAYSLISKTRSGNVGGNMYATPGIYCDWVRSRYSIDSAFNDSTPIYCQINLNCDQSMWDRDIEHYNEVNDHDACYLPTGVNCVWTIPEDGEYIILLMPMQRTCTNITTTISIT